MLSQPILSKSYFDVLGKIKLLSIYVLTKVIAFFSLSFAELIAEFRRNE